MKKVFCSILLFFILINTSFSKEVEIKFKNVDKQNGKPLMEALNLRESNRDFSNQEIDNETLGRLLWATAGINRSNGKRTFPTALNVQDITLYVINRSGSWLYSPKRNSIIKINSAGTQDNSNVIDLVYVVNLKKSKSEKYSAMHVGSMYQNAGLFCASEGLNNFVKGSFDDEEIRKKLKLSADQEILITQKIGWPQNDNNKNK